MKTISRRHMLAISAAAGTFAIGGGYRIAEAQVAKRIERLDPALDAMIDPSEPIVDLATNLGGTANVEGPLWWKEGGYLLFRGTDLKRWKYAPGRRSRSSRRIPTPRMGSHAIYRAGWWPAKPLREELFERSAMAASPCWRAAFRAALSITPMMWW